jgi:hypothetical protein
MSSFDGLFERLELIKMTLPYIRLYSACKPPSHSTMAPFSPLWGESRPQISFKEEPF